MSQQHQEDADLCDRIIDTISLAIDGVEDDANKDSFGRFRNRFIGILHHMMFPTMVEYLHSHEKYGNVFHGLIGALRMERLTAPSLQWKNRERNGDEARIRQIFKEFDIPLYIEGNYVLRKFVSHILEWQTDRDLFQ